MREIVLLESNAKGEIVDVRVAEGEGLSTVSLRWDLLLAILGVVG